MKHRIWLATGLLLLAALGVLAFQGYWTYQTYQQATQRFRQDSQAALAAAGQQTLALQQARWLRLYAQWLQNPAHVRLSCRINPKHGITEFVVASVPAHQDDQTELSFAEFKPQLTHLTPAAKAYFIKRFVGTTVRNELAQNYVFFHTQWLGRQLDSAMRHSPVTTADFAGLVAAELRRRGLAGLPFRLQLAAAARPDSRRPAPVGFPLALAPVRFGPRPPVGQVARVWLPAAPGVVLGQLQGVLVASSALLLLVLGCCGYAAGTIQRQKRLAALKADFTNNMTHELKTPVAAIQLAADSLRHFALDAATAADYAALIGEQAGRLGELIDRILRSVALERGALPLARQRVAWPELAGQLVGQHQPQFAQAGRQLAWEAAPPAAVVGDSAHLTNAWPRCSTTPLSTAGRACACAAKYCPPPWCCTCRTTAPASRPSTRGGCLSSFFGCPPAICTPSKAMAWACTTPGR